MLLGADEQITITLNRDYFYRFIPGKVAELSIRDATHEDAQYPSAPTAQESGTQPSTTEELQVTFASALTAAALSLSSTGKLDYAWTSFADGFDNGTFFNGKRK